MTADRTHAAHEARRGRAPSARRIAPVDPVRVEDRRIVRELLRGRGPEVGEPELLVGRSDDREEVEADHMADRAVASSPRLGARIDPRGPSRNEPSHERLLGGTGAPLAASIRAFMEPRFHHDFEHVRVHADSRSEQLAGSLGTRAFTIGNHVGFGRSQLDPSTESGRRLLAHELAHVARASASPTREAHVIRRAPPEEKHGAEQEPTWEDDYWYATEAEAKRRARTLEQTWTRVRYEKIEVKGKARWQVQKRGPQKDPKDEPKPKQADEPQQADEPKAPKDDSGWTRDKELDTRKEAEARKQELVAEDEWKEYRVRETKHADKVRYVVETRGKLTLGTKTFALTFDDGPHTDSLGTGKNFTEKVLDTLDSGGLKGKAAFFVQTHVPYRGASKVGARLIKRMLDDGYTVGIHTGGTKGHEKHTLVQKAGRLEGELTDAKSYLESIGGSDPTLVRAPGGETNADVRRVYAKLKLEHLHWDINGDPGAPSSLDALEKLFDKGLACDVKRGAKGTFHPKTGVSSRIVVLYHDIRKGTASHIGKVILHIKNRVPGAKFDKP